MKHIVLPASFITLLTAALSATPHPARAAAMHDMPMAGTPTHNTPTCPSPDSALPAAPGSWRSPTPITAATNEAALPKATLTPGKAALVHLANTPDISFATRPGEPGDNTSSGGMVSFTVPIAGTWQIMLGHRAWIDLLSNGTAVISTGHHHGPACSGIGKIVEFPLRPDTTYTLQLSGSSKPDIEVMVAPAK